MSEKQLNSSNKVIDFESLRNEKIEERRREYERFIFRNTLGVYTVIKQKGLHAIDLIDISEGGLSFQIAENDSFLPEAGTILDVRIYISSNYYLPIEIKIIRAVNAIENGKVMKRFGCIINKELASYSAIFHFVQFISKCAEHAHKDEGGLRIFY